MSTQYKIGSKEKKQFYEALPGVIDSAVANPKVAQIPGLEEWIKKVIVFH